MHTNTTRTPQAPDYVCQVSELSWEPTERWGQLPREVRRSRRGEKTMDHLANLRRSDPLINAWAWRDTGEELRRVEASPLARLNQQATATARRTPRYIPPYPRRTPTVPPPFQRLAAPAYPAPKLQARILRGMAEHRYLTRLLLERLDKGAEEAEAEVASPNPHPNTRPNPKPKPKPKPSPKQVAKMTERKAGRPGLHERASNDTVLDVELGQGSSRDNTNLDSLDDLDLELGWGARFVKPASMQLDPGDYSPKSVVPSEPNFPPEQAHICICTRAARMGVVGVRVSFPPEQAHVCTRATRVPLGITACLGERRAWGEG